MKWIEALKIWNAQHNAGKWCVAKKGSPEYDQVKAIMARGKEHVKTGKGTKEMMEHLKAKKAAKKPDEADTLIAEMDEILKGGAKPAASAPKAPARDVAGEMALIHQIAASHAKRYGEESEKKKKVMAFLKAAAAHIKQRRLAREAAAKPAPRAASPPRAPRRGQPDTRSRSTAPVKGRVEMSASEKEAAKARLYHNIANTEEVLRDLQARIRNPNFTVVQRNNMEMQEFKLLRIIAKMRKQVAAL